MFMWYFNLQQQLVIVLEVLDVSSFLTVVVVVLRKVQQQKTNTFEFTRTGRLRKYGSLYSSTPYFINFLTG